MTHTTALQKDSGRALVSLEITAHQAPDGIHLDSRPIPGKPRSYAVARMLERAGTPEALSEYIESSSIEDQAYGDVNAQTVAVLRVDPDQPTDPIVSIDFNARHLADDTDPFALPTTVSVTENL